MKRTSYLIWILATEAVGALSGFLTRQSVENYGQTVRKPPISPPDFLFPVVWTLLYALMGIGAARIERAQPSKSRQKALNVYVFQLVINFFWSLIFFNAQAYGAAFFWIILLWGGIILMILRFYPVDKPAALLQIPYLLWVTFAAWLTYGVWRLNR